MTSNLKDMWDRIQKQGRSDFIVSPKDRVTYRTLAQHIECACGGFDSAGLVVGDRVAIALSNELQACASFIAALLDGLVPSMISPQASDERRAAIATALEARLVLDDANPPPQPKGLFGRLGGSADLRRQPRLPEVEPDQLAYILFTSGTTAAPRGVMVTHNNLFSQLATLQRLFEYTPASRILNATPLAHTDGLVQGPLLAAATGCALLRPGPFDVGSLEHWLNFVRGETASHMVTNPTLLKIVLRMAQENDYFDPTRFKGVISTGGILSCDLWDHFETRFGVKIWNVYGMTESVADALYAGDHPEMGSRGTIGRPVDCHARISGGATEGELELSGANIVPGYWKNEAVSAETRTPDGWFRTGDIARQRSDGSYDHLGRSRTIINQGSVTIRPDEINEALLSHPDVLEVVTFAMPDADFEEIAIAVTVLANPVEPAVLFDHCNTRLEPLKRPKRIVIKDNLPKTATGKPDISRLKQVMLNGELSPETAGTSAKNAALETQLFAVAAQVFGVVIDELNLASTPDTVPGWDSFNHLKLMMEVEVQLGIVLSTKDIISIRSLGDLISQLEKTKAC